MSTLKVGSILLLLLAPFAMQVRAATVIAAGTATVKACSFALNPTAEVVSHLPYPAEWKVVVVCNENVWETLMRQDRVNFISNYAFTFQPNRVTFIRAKVFLEPMQYTPGQVLKHELGHIVCKCDDEEVAWKWAASQLETALPLPYPLDLARASRLRAPNACQCRRTGNNHVRQ